MPPSFLPPPLLFTWWGNFLEKYPQDRGRGDIPYLKVNNSFSLLVLVNQSLVILKKEVWSKFDLDREFDLDLWSKHSIKANNKTLLASVQDFTFSCLMDVTPDMRTVSKSPKFSISPMLFYYLLSIYVGNAKWCLMQWILHRIFVERIKCICCFRKL